MSQEIRGPEAHDGLKLSGRPSPSGAARSRPAESIRRCHFSAQVRFRRTWGIRPAPVISVTKGDAGRLSSHQEPSRAGWIIVGGQQVPRVRTPAPRARLAAARSLRGLRHGLGMRGGRDLNAGAKHARGDADVGQRTSYSTVTIPPSPAGSSGAAASITTLTVLSPLPAGNGTVMSPLPATVFSPSEFSVDPDLGLAYYIA